MTVSHAVRRLVAAAIVVAPALLHAQPNAAQLGAQRQIAGATIAVIVGGRALNEGFTFGLGTQRVTFAAGSWTGFTYEAPKSFPAPVVRGSAYAVTQLDGPRTCSMHNSTGAASTGNTIYVYADCNAQPTKYNFGIRTAGTTDGETVTFATDGGDQASQTPPMRQSFLPNGLTSGATLRIWRVGNVPARACRLTGDAPWAVTTVGDTVVVRGYSDVYITATCPAAPPTTASTPPTSPPSTPPSSPPGTAPGTVPAGGRGALGALLPPRQRLPVTVPPRVGGTSSLSGILRGPVGARVALQINGAGTPLSVTVPPLAGSTDRYYEKAFTFTPPRANGTPYSVTASTSDPNLTCTPYQGAIGIMPAGQPGLVVGCEPIFTHISTNTAGTVRGTFYESRDAVVGGADVPVAGSSMGWGEGRFVAFVSGASGLVNKPVKARQVYWHDRLTGETYLVSAAADGTPGDGDSFAPSISADGLTVAFESYATNLVPGDVNTVRDVFVWSSAGGMLATSVTRISVGSSGAEGNAESWEPSVSGDGRVVAFTSSASNLTGGVTGTSTANVYRRDLPTSQTTLITRGMKGPAVGGSKPSISEDGARIAFQSYSADLVPGDKNGLWDIFVYDQGTNSLSRISRPYGGGERDQGSESASREVAPAISGDGSVVAFATTSTNLVPGDRNGMQDVFVVDIRSGHLQRASVTTAGVEADGNSPVEQGGRLALSYSGEWVAFASAAKNLGAPEGNLFLHNNLTGETRPITTMTNNSPSAVSMSRSGTYVAFGSNNQYDPRARSSGMFVKFTGLANAFMWIPY
jgi:Tol biopolymer transport system component